MFSAFLYFDSEFNSLMLVGREFHREIALGTNDLEKMSVLLASTVKS